VRSNVAAYYGRDRDDGLSWIVQAMTRGMRVLHVEMSRHTLVYESNKPLGARLRIGVFIKERSGDFLDFSVGAGGCMDGSSNCYCYLGSNRFAPERANFRWSLSG
jgi:hypothetical protein